MKVSVIIPTYNRSKLVVETIESVLNQTFQDMEIVVVDDGSTDDTEECLIPYFDRIIYIKQENRGVNAARNRGIEAAKGEYIALLDSDDSWMDFKLELDVAILEEYPQLGFVFTDFTITKPDGENLKNGIRSWYTLENNWDKLYESSRPLPIDFSNKYGDRNFSEHKVYFGDLYRPSLFHPIVPTSASLYRRSAAETLPALNENDSSCGDWEFFALLSRSSTAAFVDLDTTYNRSHEDAVRLTRIDHSIQLKRRIDLINRVWRRDADFMSRYEQEVNDEQYLIYCELIQYQLISGAVSEAKTNITEMKTAKIRPLDRKFLILSILANVPGSPIALNVMRRLKHWLDV